VESDVAHPVIRILNASEAAERAQADRSDGQLLDRFVRHRDNEAFAAVVRRHGPMVLAVCRRVLRDHADADDAFQAAFLVLARKAGSLRARGLLGAWLHGVAFNTARRLRRANSRRATRERPLADASEPVAVESLTVSDELLAILDEELARLPERYRATLVLCDLEGLTRKEAARQLGCPEGTVAGRLARARALLAARLSSRGVAPSAGLLAVLLTERSTTALSPARVDGVLGAVFTGAVSRRVAITAERVVAAMFLRKLSSMALVLIACGVAVAVVGLFRSESSAGAEPAAPPDTKGIADAAAPQIAARRVLTVLPLKKLSPESAAEKLRKLVPAWAIITPVVDDRVLLVYADEKATGEIEKALVSLGETPRKKLTRIALRFSGAADIASSLTEIFVGPPAGRTGPPRLTIVPVPDENALLVYATDADTLSIRKLLAEHIDAPAAGGKREEKPKPEAKRYSVRFEKTPWKDVLKWYAEVSGLQFVGDSVPAGTLTLMPARDQQFTRTEVIDLLNEALMPQKFILIRRETTLVLHPADEKVDSTLLPRIDLSELSNRGKTELVQVVISLKKDSVQVVAPEIQKLLSPFGSVTQLLTSNALVIVDTAGNIARIRSAIVAMEQANVGDTLTHVCKFKKAEEVAVHLRILLTDEKSDSKSFKITWDERTHSVFVAGPPGKISLARTIIEEFDRAPGSLKSTELELRKYPVPPSTADATAKALIAANPSLRVIAIQAANELWIMATPEEHLQLAEKLKLPGNSHVTIITALIPLTAADPQKVASMAAGFYPRRNGGPTVLPGFWGMKLIIVSGSPGAIEQIREIIKVLESVRD